METWMLYGLLAAVFLGTSAIVMKLATGPEHYNLDVHTGAMLVLIGAAIVFIPYYLFESKFQLTLPNAQTAILLAILSGALWAMASLFLYKGFNIGADASKIIPLMNTSALVAVLLGVILLHELPTHGEAWRVVTGAVLMVIGAFLVT